MKNLPCIKYSNQQDQKMKISLLLSGLAALLIQMYVTALPTMLPTSTTVLEYEDYLAFMQQKQQEQREKRAPSSHCSLFAFTYTLENEDGCVGYIPLFGCAGRCSTGETPNYYQSRYVCNTRLKLSVCETAAKYPTYVIIASVHKNPLQRITVHTTLCRKNARDV